MFSATTVADMCGALSKQISTIKMWRWRWKEGRANVAAGLGIVTVVARKLMKVGGWRDESSLLRQTSIEDGSCV